MRLSAFELDGTTHVSAAELVAELRGTTHTTASRFIHNLQSPARVPETRSMAAFVFGPKITPPGGALPVWALNEEQCTRLVRSGVLGDDVDTQAALAGLAVLWARNLKRKAIEIASDEPSTTTTVVEFIKARKEPYVNEETPWTRAACVIQDLAVKLYGDLSGGKEPPSVPSTKADAGTGKGRGKKRAPPALIFQFRCKEDREVLAQATRIFNTFCTRSDAEFKKAALEHCKSRGHVAWHEGVLGAGWVV